MQLTTALLLKLTHEATAAIIPIADEGLVLTEYNICAFHVLYRLAIVVCLHKWFGGLGNTNSHFC